MIMYHKSNCGNIVWQYKRLSQDFFRNIDIAISKYRDIYCVSWSRLNTFALLMTEQTDDDIWLKTCASFLHSAFGYLLSLGEDDIFLSKFCFVFVFWGDLEVMSERGQIVYTKINRSHFILTVEWELCSWSSCGEHSKIQQLITSTNCTSRRRRPHSTSLCLCWCSNRNKKVLHKTSRENEKLNSAASLSNLTLNLRQWVTAYSHIHTHIRHIYTH